MAAERNLSSTLRLTAELLAELISAARVIESMLNSIGDRMMEGQRRHLVVELAAIRNVIRKAQES